MKSMEDVMLELEMAVLALQLDASATGSLKNVNCLSVMYSYDYEK